ncbi:MAG: class I SAM-dependent methyltransferase [Betaproteobacteria bacterium]|nr:class I SAM-dependent methyltransferase [Betaproteobacteria bacterium]
MTKLFGGDKTSAYEAASKAQQIAFAPAFFQAIIVLRDKGVLAYLNENDEGKSEMEIAKSCSLNDYAARILLEAGEQAGVLIFAEGRYYLSKTGFMLISDETARRNMSFINDVCYQGLFFLGESIDKEKPVGLEVFGEWDTIYEGLSQYDGGSKLPENVKNSWFEFTHYYSDAAFNEALKIIFLDNSAKKILDVGGNTGRFAIKCAQYNKDAKVTILDKEGLLNVAKENARNAGLIDRIDGFALDLIDHSKEFPTNYDAVWMSQFLDCFPPNDIVELLKRGRKALAEGGYLYIMEPFVDTQQHPQAKYALVGTSLYFTAMANGTSRMYRCGEMIEYAKAAGLELVEQFDGVGAFQTILKLESRSS